MGISEITIRREAEVMARIADELCWALSSTRGAAELPADPRGIAEMAIAIYDNLKARG